MSQGRLTQLAASAAVVLGLAGSALANAPELEDIVPSRACGTEEIGQAMVAPDVATIRKWIGENRIAAGGVIPVYFHVIYNGSTGNVPDSQLDAQITVLNNTFAGKGYNGTPISGAANTGYTFYKAGTDRTNSRRWFTMTPGSAKESQAKNALAINPAGALNVYTCAPGQGLLGWAVFPWSSQAKTNMDGVVIHYGSVPGGYLSPYNLGGTATHEVGHWVGLYHTFQGGCTGGDTTPGCTTGGDLVCDTAAEATATTGCPAGKNTCASGGPDPIDNYMDYSYDSCYNKYTTGQDARMDWAMSTYRPIIGSAKASLGSPVAATPPAPDMDVTPNPFNPTTAIDFALPRGGYVSLHVYDVSGRKVRTLVDGQRDAGAHRAVFDGTGLSSGIYVAVLRVDQEKLVKRLVLTK